MPSEPTDEKKLNLKNQVVTIIHHQTGGPQPPTIDTGHIKLVASHANTDPEDIEWAIEELTAQGAITEGDSGYKLGTETIDRNEISL